MRAAVTFVDTVYAALLLGEIPTSSFYVGAGMIVSGVALAVWQESAGSSTASTPHP